MASSPPFCIKFPSSCSPMSKLGGSHFYTVTCSHLKIVVSFCRQQCAQIMEPRHLPSIYHYFLLNWYILYLQKRFTVKTNIQSWIPDKNGDKHVIEMLLQYIIFVARTPPPPPPHLVSVCVLGAFMVFRFYSFPKTDAALFNMSTLLL